MKPLPQELVDLYDERVALRIRQSVLRDNGADPAAADQTRERLTTVNYRIQRLERARCEPTKPEHGTYARPRERALA